MLPLICNDERVCSVLNSILPCFPMITKGLKAFVAGTEEEMNEFLDNSGCFLSKRLPLSDFGGCVYYDKLNDNPGEYILLFNKLSCDRTTETELIGTCAHELAHCELGSNYLRNNPNNFDIKDIYQYFDPEKRFLLERIKADPQYSIADPPSKSSNEYITDALAIGRGFGYEVSCYSRLARKQKPYMSSEEIDAFWSL